MAASSAVNSTIRMVVKTNANNLTKGFTTQGGPTAWYLRKLSTMFGMFSNGAFASNTVVTVTAVAATGTVTFSSVVAADTVTIGGTVFTGSDSSSGTAQFRTGGTDTTAATSLAAVINANTTTNKFVSATSALGVVTLTCVVPGTIGNLITIAISAHGSVSGSGKLTSGAEGATNTYAHGL